jgi:hypothetical protein
MGEETRCVEIAARVLSRRLALLYVQRIRSIEVAGFMLELVSAEAQLGALPETS